MYRFPESMWQAIEAKLETEKELHIALVTTRTLKGPDCNYTYFQSVCSCGWSGDYKVSKLTAQEDKCPNR